MTVPSRDDKGGDWPTRLLNDLAAVPLVDEELLKNFVAGDPSRTLLSKKEKDVLTGLSVGLTIEMIAEVYGCSIETVKTHLKKAKFVLRAKNSYHALALALRQGQIS